MLHRRQVLSGFAAAALPFVQPHPPPIQIWRGLRRLTGIAFGSAFDREIFSDAAYADLIARECRIGSLENSLKFDWIRPNGPEADYSEADKLVQFARAHGIKPRGTALIWNDWTPDWLKELSAEDCRAMMSRHIRETVGRYAGQVASWDVVNEPFFPTYGDDRGYRTGPWHDAMGPDYIMQAFRDAAAADPKAQLVLNEAFCEQFDELGNGVRPLLYAQVKAMKAAGVKIDAVGFEAHLKPYLPSDDAAFAAYVQSIGELGVDVMITELDVDDSHMPDDPALRDGMVADRLTRFLSAVLPVKAVTTVICWHLSDKYSWYRGEWYDALVEANGGTPGRQVRSHLYDDQLRPKAAVSAVAEALAASPNR